MTLTRIPLALALLSSLAAACSVETTGREGAGEAPERGLGKADGVFGSCGTDDANSCGGQASEGNCWCDELCVDFGDCCSDKADVCGGDGNVDPTPKLCLGDDACGAGEVCDHSECLSGCPDGGICPAVCFGQCVPGDDEPACHTLDEKQCGEADGCEWNTVDGFPGPISFCEDVEECDIDPKAVFCSDGTFFNVEACACLPLDDDAADCEPDDSYVAVTGAELAADPQAFVGTRIWLTGEANLGFPICTQLACFPENPCCNSCGAGISMDLDDVDIEMSGIGCGGNECTVMSNCDYGSGESFTAWGTLEESFGTLHLQIDGHCGV